MSTDTLKSVLASFDQWQASPLEVRSHLDDVLRGKRRCYVLGRNHNSAFMAERLPVAGFLDDFVEPGTVWHGLPVLPCSDLPTGSVVINAVLLRRPHQALARLASLPQPPIVVHYADFMRLDPVKFVPPIFVQEARSVVADRADAFAALGDRLEDEESREVMKDVLLYRLTGDPAFTRGYQIRDEDEYFDLPFVLPQGPVFVDGGAYRGETTELFCRHYPDYSCVHLFEPNAGSLAKAKSRLGSLEHIHYYNNAVGDVRAHVAFDDSAENASRITGEGGEGIEAMPIDELSGKVDFIKLDVEGYETKALVGARRSISDFHPSLAICIYHRITDFIDVPGVVLAIRDDYRLYIRHYTEGLEETVMYFVPRN
jgi:FkbM family methyltransferase